tara:strand:+ start:948 stop:1349 length:402 start_codon:yes stop_codon:yes gene_type:complete
MMVTQSDIMNPPATWAGSRPEWMFYASLMKLGYQPSEDFIYQSPMLGGRLDKGGWIIDFVFHNPPGLAVNVQGTYYHYELGAATSARDKFAREALAGQGITLIFVDEDDLEQDPTGITEAALQFNDRSRLGGR